MNRVIRDVSAATGTTVVEVDAALASASRNGVIGNSLMLEHLHPNLRGYFLLADAYFHSLIRQPGEPSWNEGPDRATAWQEIPVTEIDDLAAGYRLRYLKSDWPFQEQRQPVVIEPPRDPVEQIAQAWFFGKIGWQEAMQQALAHYQKVGRFDQAAKVAINLADAFPFESRPHYVSGSLLLESYFGIPGIGLVTFNAITSGDQPILKAVVGLTGVLFVLALMINDMLYSLVDPRVAKP